MSHSTSPKGSWGAPARLGPPGAPAQGLDGDGRRKACLHPRSPEEAFQAGRTQGGAPGAQEEGAVGGVMAQPTGRRELGSLPLEVAPEHPEGVAV